MRLCNRSVNSWCVGRAGCRAGCAHRRACPPPSRPPALQGTKCEPWLARPAVTLLHELLLPGTAKGLEWGSGSGTLWLLAGHVKHLTTIEHNPAWLVLTQGAAEDAFSAQFLQASRRRCCCWMRWGGAPRLRPPPARWPPC